LSDYSIWNLKETLAPMTWPQRAEYLLTYYKWVLVALVIIIVLISIVVSAVGNARTELLLSGVLVNAPIDEACYDYLSDGCFQYLGGQKGQAVELAQVDLMPDAPIVGADTTVTAVSKIVGLITLDRLDYMIVDDQAYGYFLQQEMYADLRSVLSESELAQWQDKLIYDAQQVPMAIDLAGTSFSERFLPADTAFYLIFIPSSGRLETCKAFLSYLK